LPPLKPWKAMKMPIIRMNVSPSHQKRLAKLMDRKFRVWNNWKNLHTNLCQRSEEHTSELQSRENLVCRLLLEKKKKEAVQPEKRRRRGARAKKPSWRWCGGGSSSSSDCRNRNWPGRAQQGATRLIRRQRSHRP